MRVVRPWPRLPREAVAAPSLAELKARVDGALSTLGCGKGSLLMAGGLEPDDLQGPFQPKPFCRVGWLLGGSWSAGEGRSVGLKGAKMGVFILYLPHRLPCELCVVFP